MKKANIAELTTMDYFTREAFNSFRTNLRFSGKDIKVVLITSCQPNEGKSETVLDLCRVLAGDGKRVLLADLDLRKSVLVGRHNVTAEGEILGMSHYLTGQAELADIVYNTNVEGMDVIFTGPVPPNPTELLGGGSFAAMLTEMRPHYDMIILDTPPLGTVIDAAIVAPYCDGAVLVIQSKSISYRFAQNVKGQLEKAGCRLLGAVLNKMDVTKDSYYHHYGYGYGGYYYKEYYRHDEKE